MSWEITSRWRDRRHPRLLVGFGAVAYTWFTSVTKELAMLKIITAALAFFVACGISDDTSSTDRAIIPSSTCAADADCPSGFACEIEVEHGVTTSFCQAHSSSSQCPAGYEREVEHGQAYCKPHGGDGGGSAGAASGATCATDSDCAVGLECEWEHGAASGFCKPLGGR